MIVIKKDSKNAVYDLYISTLGRFEMNRQNKGAYNISSRTTKLWDLFKYLLAHNGKGIAPEIILEDLYPEETYENPKNTLQNNIYRLRKLLKEDSFFSSCGCSILFSNGCYSLHFAEGVGVDADIFEHSIQMAECNRQRNPDEAIMYYKSALLLYGGGYLPEMVYGDWVIPIRNYYQRKYIQAVLQLTELYKQKRAYDDSIRICEKALQVEHYDEELNIRFMESLIWKGRLIEAKKHYTYITSALYKQFGVKPTTEIQKVYQMLKDNNLQQSKENMIDDFQKEENSDGAFYCDEKLFHSILVLEKRRSDRTGKAVYLVSIALDNSYDLVRARKGNPNVFQEFRRFFANSLRKGDVITTWKNSQILLLLSGIEYKQIRNVAEDIIKRFQSKINIDDLYTKVEVHSFLP